MLALRYSHFVDVQESVAQRMSDHYQIVVKEYLEESWSAWFDDLAITHGQDGSTTLAGVVRDQTALYGLITKLRDLGLTLVSVAQTL